MIITFLQHRAKESTTVEYNISQKIVLKFILNSPNGKTLYADILFVIQYLYL